jgi:hypothetical protein
MYGLLLDQLGGVHPERLGELADGTPLCFYPARLEVEDARRTHVGPFRQVAVREKPRLP